MLDQRSMSIFSVAEIVLDWVIRAARKLGETQMEVEAFKLKLRISILKRSEFELEVYEDEFGYSEARKRTNH